MKFLIDESVEKAIVDWLRDRKHREYRSINNVSNVIAAFQLQALIKKGILRSEGRGRATHYLMNLSIND